jgi:hypothetical protein
MSCTRHFLGFQWERHSWRRVVSSTDSVQTHNTDMWGRVVGNEHVRCRTQYVCDACGKAGLEAVCMCDTAEGERCPVRLACLDASGQTTAAAR